MTNKGTPCDPEVKYHFDNPEFDFFLQWIQGAQTFGGSEGGECFYVASQIEEGNPDSLVTEWTSMAKRVATRDCVLDPSLITALFLNMISEQERLESPQFKEFAELTKEKATNPLNKFEVMPANEGADSHAIGTNLSLY